MIYYAEGSASHLLSDNELREGLYRALDRIGHRQNVIAVPPDITRFHSRAGILTRFIHHYYEQNLKAVLPAIGTHEPMTTAEMGRMYEGVPQDLFHVHRWKDELSTLGTVPPEYVEELSEGKLSFSWPAQVNRTLHQGNFDLILSVGQVVPHEVAGMANFNKNIFVGTGGKDGINKSHYLGAVYGMERIMGRADTPVRRLLNYASRHFGAELPIVYVLTVVGRAEDGKLVTRGLFIGDDEEVFYKAAELSAEVNITQLDSPLQKVVVYLDPDEFRSTWLGNKSVYRTRMAIADGGELLVLAPGLRHFGEDAEADRLIRKYGYVTTEEVLEKVSQNKELQQTLGAAAHLIHGSSEHRFTITYCPGHLSREEIEGVGYQYYDISRAIERYNPDTLTDGFHTMPDGEEIFFISNPAVGLWTWKDRFR